MFYDGFGMLPTIRPTLSPSGCGVESFSDQTPLRIAEQGENPKGAPEANTPTEIRAVKRELDRRQRGN